MKRLVIVMGKASEPGRVKTRLVPPLQADDAARLNGAMIRATLRRTAGFDWDVELHLAGQAGADDGLPHIAVVPQTGDGLGPRMSAALENGFARGYSAVILLGSDHPTVPTDYLEAAFRALEAAGGIAIGPSEDGGYYLLGMTTLVPQLFDGIAFSVPSVFTETMRRVRALGLSAEILPEWYDVDQAADLERLREELASSHDADAELRSIIEDIGP
jgi:rSAM/selenodomain-associated transferase 1